MDDDRLKRAGGGNYFKELLARIRDIRRTLGDARANEAKKKLSRLPSEPSYLRPDHT